MKVGVEKLDSMRYQVEKTAWSHGR